MLKLDLIEYALRQMQQELAKCAHTCTRNIFFLFLWERAGSDVGVFPSIFLFFISKIIETFLLWVYFIIFFLYESSNFSSYMENYSDTQC